MTQRAGGSPPALNADVIEVHVRELVQLFDSMDPSPFHEKDLDRRFETYVISSVKELPSREPTALVIYVDAPAPPAAETRATEAAIHVHFARCAELARRDLRELLRRGWISLAIGLSVLTAGVFGGVLAGRWIDGAVGNLVRESLLIGGWVAMWRPIEIFLYDWWGVRRELRVHERLALTPVRFVHEQPASMPRYAT